MFKEELMRKVGRICRAAQLEQAAKLMGMNHNTIRKGLKQGRFPWGMQSRLQKIIGFISSMLRSLQKLKELQFKKGGLFYG